MQKQLISKQLFPYFFVLNSNIFFYLQAVKYTSSCVRVLELVEDIELHALAYSLKQ